MDTTTIKLYKGTKSLLDSFKESNETYDEIINKIISEIKNKNLRKELIEAYTKSGDLEILKEWENASGEVD